MMIAGRLVQIEGRVVWGLVGLFLSAFRVKRIFNAEGTEGAEKSLAGPSCGIFIGFSALSADFLGVLSGKKLLNAEIAEKFR